MKKVCLLVLAAACVSVSAVEYTRQASTYEELPLLPASKTSDVLPDGNRVWLSRFEDGKVHTDVIPPTVAVTNYAFIMAGATASMRVVCTNNNPTSWQVLWEVVGTNGMITTNSVFYPKSEKLVIKEKFETQQVNMRGLEKVKGVIVSTNGEDSSDSARMQKRVMAVRDTASGSIRQFQELVLSEAERETLKVLETCGRNGAVAVLADKIDDKVKIIVADDKGVQTNYVTRKSMKVNTSCARRERVGNNVVCYWDDGRVETNAIKFVNGAKLENPYDSKFGAVQREKLRKELEDEAGMSWDALKLLLVGVGGAGLGALGGKKKQG